MFRTNSKLIFNPMFLSPIANPGGLIELREKADKT